MSTQTHQTQQKQSNPLASSAKKPAKPEKQEFFEDNPLQLSPLAGLTHPDVQLSPGNFQFLQRTIGNQAVGRIIQAKLKIGQPGDKYEQEADRVADTVISMPAPQVHRQPEDEEEEIKTKPIADQITPIIQRQAEEEEDIQAKTFSDQFNPLILRQEEEEETAQTEPLLQQQVENEELLAKSISPDIPTIQRRVEPEEEDPAQTKSLIQRQGAEEEEAQTKNAEVPRSAVSQDVTSNINAMQGGGNLLSPQTREFFESRFGADFSSVRIHTDSSAAETSNSINARAFTVGKNITFGAGQYSPETHVGKNLLAHELTHVIQHEKYLHYPISGNYSDLNRQILFNSNDSKFIQSYGEPSSIVIRTPAEFEVSSGLFLAWTQPNEEALAQIVLASYQSIQVYILADTNDWTSIATFLSDRGINTSMIFFVDYATDTIWIRDFAPIWVVDENANRRLIDPFYYPDSPFDDVVTSVIANVLAIPPEFVHEMPIYLEGGNFMSNGDGVCVATESIEEFPWNLPADRLSTQVVEQYFFTYIGCDRTILLRPLEAEYPGIDTSSAHVIARVAEGTGHVDMFAKFLNRNTVLLGEYQSSNSVPFSDTVQQDFNMILEDNRNILENEGFTVIRVPMPPLPPITLANFRENTEGEYIARPIVRSYTNSLIINSAEGDRIILLPTYGDPVLDLEAELLYNELMPEYTIFPIDSSALIIHEGAVHCTTTLLPCRIDNCGEEMIVYFEFDEDTLNTDEQNAIIRRNYHAYLLANPDKMISLEGHTDDVGSKEYNQRLSLSRANAVKKFLINTVNVPSNRILPPVGFGEDDPRIPGTSEYARGQNRRVEISFE